MPVAQTGMVLETTLYAVALAVSSFLLLLCLLVRLFHEYRLRRGLPPLQRVELGVYLFSASAGIFAADAATLLFRAPLIQLPFEVRPVTVALLRVLAVSLLANWMFRYCLRQRQLDHPDQDAALIQALDRVQRTYRTNLICWGFVLFCHLLMFFPALNPHLLFLDNVQLYLFWEGAAVALALTFLPRGDHQVGWRFHLALVAWLFSVLAYDIVWLAQALHIIAVGTLVVAIVWYQLEQRLALTQSRNALARERDIIINFLDTISTDPHATGEDKAREVIAPPQASSHLNRFTRERVLRVTLDFAMAQVNASAGCIFLLEEEHAADSNRPSVYLAPREVRGLYPPQTDISGMDYVAVKQKYLGDLVRQERIPLNQTIVGEVAATGIPRLLVGSDAATRFPHHNVDYLTARSAMVLPLIASGKVEGVLSLLQVGAESPAPPFTEADMLAIRALVDQAAIALKNASVIEELREKERLERDMRLAQDVQRLLLPDHCPELPGYGFAALCRSAHRVGGDYYDFVRMADNRWAIVIADVSGKGVPGALAMAMVRSTLLAEAGRCTSGEELLNTLNRFIARDLRKDMFVSMLLAVLDPDRRVMTVWRAGHEPAIRLRGAHGDAEEIAPAGIAMGLDAADLFQQTLESQCVTLAEGDLVVFYTDGVTEARNVRNEEFSIGRFIDVLRRVRHLGAREIAQEVNRRIAEFTGNMPQHDDLTLVVMQVATQAAASSPPNASEPPSAP